MKPSIKKSHLLLVSILLLALSLRFFGMNWDQGFHLHPDERMLIMVTERIHFFNELNPHFFNYGTLPVYLLKGTAHIFSSLGGSSVNYDSLLPFGRMLSTVADLVTVFLIFKIITFFTKNRRIASMGTLFYAVAFFPIQNSHFFIVDPFLTLWITLLWYIALLYSEKPTALKTIILGVISAAAITTKFSAILFLPIIPVIIVLAGKRDRWKNAVLYIVSLMTFSFIFMPYAFLEYHQFIKDTLLQTQMSKDPYLFPYTLQYVGTVAYWYPIRNIILWGLGPFLSFFSMVGMIYFLRTLFHEKKHLKKYLFNTPKYLVLVLYIASCMIYFVVIGQSAVKFMRYFLPLYPILCVAAAFGFEQLVRSRHLFLRIVSFAVLGMAIVWTFCFVAIYTHPNTRVSASKWILDTIPKGSTLAVEHWDDRLPIAQSEDYAFEELQLYNSPDTTEKWAVIEKQLQKSDYIIVASNRLYGPLQRLVDCTKYKVCYPNANKYYNDLFSGALPFRKVAEFYVHPAFGIDDQSADESFTVYDHPKIMIFKKISEF